MSVWLALVLPALPLQLAQRSLDAALARTLTLVVVDGPMQRAQVAFCNDKARRAGIVPGMKLAAAQALTHELTAIWASAQGEPAALQELACWAYQFSAAIVPFTTPLGSGLLLETGASERLFGGQQALLGRILGGLRQLGYRGSHASAATPAAARVLCLARAAGLNPADATRIDGLRAVLEPLPVRLLAWEPQINEALQALGLQTIGAVLALPRDAFARRFGAHRLIELDRMLGTLADPQTPFVPPQRFQARIELPADLVDAARLLVPLQRLLQLLEGFLRGRNAGATALMLRACHDRQRANGRTPTSIALALAAPERDARLLLRLFQERLTRATLPEPATALELELQHMAELVPQSASFLPPAPQTAAQGADILQLTQTLHARLGAQGAFRLQARGDHRPEHSYSVLALSPGVQETPEELRLPAQRPLLILPAPRRLQAPVREDGVPQYGGPLALLAGPERIEAGWWDLGSVQRARVQRDYFVARNELGQTLWIYRELAAPHAWFLHGFFS